MAEETKAERKARVAQEKADAKAAKQAEKVAAVEAKAQEKAAKAQAKADAKKAKADAKAAKKAAKRGEAPPAEAAAVEPTSKEAAKQRKLAERWERYNQLRANVRRRRMAYGLAIFFGIVVFLATAWDIVFNESAYKWFLLPVFVALIVWELILLFSRRRHLQEVAELAAMSRTYLECENCKTVFQFGELRFGERRRVGFGCPVCSEESALPGPDSTPVERVLPEATVVEAAYRCGNCDEQIVVGTFGATPRESIFRACPHCGLPGQVAVA